jgi:hypothetical protein
VVISPVVTDLVNVDGPNEPVTSAGKEHEVVVNQIKVSSINVAVTPAKQDALSVTDAQLVKKVVSVVVVGVHEVVVTDVVDEVVGIGATEDGVVDA